MRPWRSRQLMALIRRIAALVAILTLAVGNMALCAGWEDTPEARMACCMSGPRCPMHSSDAGRVGSSRLITQAAADQCCAGATDSRQSSTTGSVFVLATAMPPMSIGILLPAPARSNQEWRALAPRPVPRIPTHLRLSVLLI